MTYHALRNFIYTHPVMIVINLEGTNDTQQAGIRQLF